MGAGGAAHIVVVRDDVGAGEQQHVRMAVIELQSQPLQRSTQPWIPSPLIPDGSSSPFAWLSYTFRVSPAAHTAVLGAAGSSSQGDNT